MSREILFRGFCLYKQTFVEGSLVKILTPQGTDYYIKPSLSEARFGTGLPVEEPSIGQFTGFLDKNGVKIFEGDCLGNPLNVVEFSGGCWNTNGDRRLGGNNIEVVGNIHDKPEWIGGGDE